MLKYTSSSKNEFLTLWLRLTKKFFYKIKFWAPILVWCSNIPVVPKSNSALYDFGTQEILPWFLCCWRPLLPFFFGWLAGWVMICLVQVLVIWMGWLWIGKDWLVGCIWVRFVISGSVYGYWDRFVSYMDWKLRNYTAWEPRTPRNSMSAYLLSNSINDGWPWTNDDCCSSDW